MIVNRKKDVKKIKINWLKIRPIVYDKKQLFQIIIKDGAENCQLINIKKQKVTQANFVNISLPHLFPFSRKITKAKYNDLKQLINYLPVSKRQFYRDLEFEDDSDNDYDYGLASEDSDCE